MARICPSLRGVFLIKFPLRFPRVYLVRAVRDTGPPVVRRDRLAIHFLPQCAVLAVEAARPPAVARTAIVP
jgi:hypothetical protein